VHAGDGPQRRRLHLLCPRLSSRVLATARAGAKGAGYSGFAWAWQKDPGVLETDGISELGAGIRDGVDYRFRWVDFDLAAAFWLFVIFAPALAGCGAT
jgi:hypothetical protein